MTTTANQQLELGFSGTQSRIFVRRRQTRVARAQWWFAQMRAAVADAIAWPAPGEAAAEQIMFPGVVAAGILACRKAGLLSPAEPAPLETEA